MPERAKGRTAGRHFIFRGLTFAVRWSASAALAITLGYLVVPDPAVSQINGRVTAPPFSAAAPTTANDEDATVTPKVPVQAEMPPPPPTRYVPGMEEALIATGAVSDAENKDLDAALSAFHDAPAKTPGGDYDDYAQPLLAFISAHPDSHWNAALYTNIGLGFYHAGYYSRTYTYLEKAWQLGRNATNFQTRLIIDRAVAELARMHARVGHADELDALFKDIGTRPIGGPGAELMTGAKNGLWSFRHTPETSYLCGPKALRNVLRTLKATRKQIKVAEDARSGPHGFSLTELAALADKAKLKYTLIHREPGQPIPVPSVVNWNVHHYAAIVAEHDGGYEVLDPTFAGGGANMLTAKAIDAEGSGYFLVPAKATAHYGKAGWRKVSAHSAEAKATYGMGDTSSTQSSTRTGDCNACGNPPAGHMLVPPSTTPQNIQDIQSIPNPPMTIANVSSTAVSLNLSDTPVGYTPQIGPSARTTIAYNQRDVEQAATMSFSNLGSLWSHGWMVYIMDDPVHLGMNVRQVASGGGGYDLVNNYNSSTGTWAGDPYDSAKLYRSPLTGVATSYERDLADGSKEFYTLSNGAATYPRLMFLTSVADPKGNTTTLHYDGTFRLTSITDATGRNTTFSYTLTGFPLLITKITDPFSRFAQINYDTSQRVSSITDPIGITSSFTYSTTEPTFVTQLTTPYGNTTFSDALPLNDVAALNTRALAVTDPLGYTDFVYFYQNPNFIPQSESVYPSGMAIYNGYLSYRNTFHWNPHQFTTGVTLNGSGQILTEDPTKASVAHWLHYWDQVQGVLTVASGATESTKQPLENRVWYNMDGAPFAYSTGPLNHMTYQGRVLDDGVTTQLLAANYDTNWPGPLELANDALGRSQKYNYAANLIDLLTVQQYTSYATYTTIATFGSYNSQHEPQTYTGADGQTWHYTYNASGQLATVTDPNTGLTTYNYKGGTGPTQYQLLSVTNANNLPQVSYTYDTSNRIHTRTDSELYTLTYAYDALDRITSITYPDGTKDLYNYNFQSGPLMGTPSLELRKHTDRLNRVTTYNYDADRRLTSVVEPTSGSATRTTQYQYYEDGTLKDIIDANNNDTHWDIDIQSRPIDKIYGFGGTSPETETYAYEATTSRLHSITDALGQVKTFGYTVDDRINTITYTSTINPTPNVTFNWDGYFPRLASMVDGTGTTTYSYGPIGSLGGLKLSSVAGPYTNSTIGLTYDALGRLATRTVPGGNESFGYDPISRMNSHVTPLGSFTYGYLGQTDQTASRSVTNGSTTVSTGWVYDTNANDRRLININNSGVTRSYTLGYGSSPVNVYDIMSITDTAATGHPWATQSRAYTYDKADRLLTASSTTPGNDTYAYDKLDNATTVTTPSGTVTPAPAYNGFNQTKTWGSLTYTYDSNGNLTSGDGVHTYKYDAENRLIEIDYVGTSNKSVFTYDGLGHRTTDSETVSGTTTTTHYLWCGSTICQTRDGSDNVLKRDLDEGEFTVSGSTKHIYMPDQLGSVRDALDATTGLLVQSYDFTPYGSVARSNGTSPTDYQFAGLWQHPQSGLNLATFRAHNGIDLKWLNRDPIREAGGPNLYSYVDAQPILYPDRSGLISNRAKYFCAALPLLCHPDENNPQYNPPSMEEPGELPSSLNPFYPDSGDPLDPTGTGTEPEQFCRAPKGLGTPIEPPAAPVLPVLPWWFRGIPPSFMPPMIMPPGGVHNPWDPTDPWNQRT